MEGLLAAAAALTFPSVDAISSSAWLGLSNGVCCQEAIGSTGCSLVCFVSSLRRVTVAESVPQQQQQQQVVALKQTKQAQAAAKSTPLL
jgi:hypothetical protein